MAGLWTGIRTRTRIKLSRHCPSGRKAQSSRCRIHLRRASPCADASASQSSWCSIPWTGRLSPAIELVLYQKFAPEFDRLGARLLGISVDSVYCHVAFARDARLHFPLLADFHPRGRVARRFGIYRDKQGMSARALFVLDRGGKIRFSRAYPDLLNPGVDEALAALETLAAESGEGERGKES